MQVKEKQGKRYQKETQQHQTNTTTEEKLSTVNEKHAYLEKVKEENKTTINTNTKDILRKRSDTLKSIEARQVYKYGKNLSI